MHWILAILLLPLMATAQTQLPADRSIFTDAENLQQKYDAGTLGANEAVHLSGTGAPTAPCSNIGADRYTDTAAQTEYYCSATNTWTQYAGGGSGGIPFDTPVDTDGNGIPDTMWITTAYDGDITGSAYSDIGAALDWMSVGLDPAGNPATWRSAVLANNFGTSR